MPSPFFCAFERGEGRGIAAATIAIACGAVGVEFELCRQGAEAWSARTGHTVRLISTPNDANERLALFQQLLAARSPDIDVFQIDVVWPGILAPYLEDLTPHIARKELAGHFPALVTNNRVNGRLVALPWFADVGLLYFRRDPAGEIRGAGAANLASADGDRSQHSGG